MVAELIVKIFELFVVLGIFAFILVVCLYRRHAAEVERSYLNPKVSEHGSI